MNSEIDKAVKSIQDKWVTVQNRRAAWSNATVPMLNRKLEEIANKYPEVFMVTRNDLYDNFESIQLSMKSKHSGIVEHKPNGGLRAFVYHGGYLNYAQIPSGKIIAVSTMPYVDELVEKTPPIVLGKYEPDALEENLIEEHILQFLKHLNEWSDEWSMPNESVNRTP